MRRARMLLVPTMVAWGAACTLTQPLDGLTGGAMDASAGSDAANDAIKDVAADAQGMDAQGTDARDAGDAGSLADAGEDSPAVVDASDGGPPVDVVQPDVVTGAVSCADAGVLLCEDFENGLSATKWLVPTGSYATAVVDGTQHHRGSYALHASMPALATDGSAVNVQGDIRHVAPLPSPIFIRAFVMFSSAQPQGVESFFVAVQNQSPYYGLQLELVPQGGDYAMTDWTVSPSFYASSPVPASAATWTCVEWELDPPASGTTTTNSDVWVDGAEVPSLHFTNTPMSDLGVLDFGIGFYQVTSLPAYDLWIDDVYVDTSRVGCDK